MTDSATVQTFDVVLPEPELTPFERERQAFLRLLPDLLLTHRGQYVAVHGEQVVDSGLVRADVVARTLDRVRADIFVGLVTEEPPPVVRSGIRRMVDYQRPYR